MDLRRLAHLVALAELGNFARAAEQLHLSQPALTRSVQAAEAELGLRLFDRGPNGVRPTPAGVFVVERARRLVQEGRGLERDVKLLRERRLGDTAFGAGPYPAAIFLAPMLTALRRSHPGVGLRVVLGSSEQLVRLLRDETIEFFVADTRELPADPGLLLRPLAEAQAGFYVRAGHALADRGSVGLAELWSWGVATVRVPAALEALIASRLELPAGSRPPLALECDDLTTLMQVVLATDSVLVAAERAAATAVAEGRLRRLEVPELPPLASRVGVVALRGRTPSPSAEMIINRLPEFAA